MSPLVYVALFGWLLVALVLFHYLGGARGFVATVVGGFLLLTPVSLRLVEGVPPWDRSGAIALAALAGTLLFTPGVLQRYRFHWLDLVMLATLLGWGLTNLFNRGGMTQALVDWWWFSMFAAIPYFLARCHFADPSNLPFLARGIVVGALLMAPFMLYELVMSPRLHYDIYGFGTGNVMERFRMGGWRPRVFQPAGLGLAIWLAGAAAVAVALFWSGVRSRLLNLSTGAAAVAAVVLGFMSRGAGAISLMIMALAIMLGVRQLKWRMVTLVVPAVAVVYIATAIVDSEIPIRPVLTDVSEAVFGGDRAASLDTRFRNEVFLVNRAWERPFLGWGGWGDYRGEALAWQVGHGRVLTDGLWVITLGQRGLWGVIGLYGIFLLPGVLALVSVVRAKAAPGAIMLVLGLALFCWLYALDLLFNAFPSPVQAMVGGALTSVAVAMRLRRPSRMPTTPASPGRLPPVEHRSAIAPAAMSAAGSTR
jgi:hypothetical protein